MKPRRSRITADSSVMSVCDSLLTMESTSSLSTMGEERIAQLLDEYSEENLSERFDGGGDKNRQADDFGRSSALYDAMMRVFERVKRCASTAYCSLPDRRGSLASSSGSGEQQKRNESDELARSMATFLHRALIADDGDGDEIRRFAASLIEEWRKQGSSRIRTSTRHDQPVPDHADQDGLPDHYKKKEEDESSRILSFRSSTPSSTGDGQAKGEIYKDDAKVEPDRSGCRNRQQARCTEIKQRRSKEEQEEERRWSDFEQASSYYCSDDLFHAGKRRRYERGLRLLRKRKASSTRGQTSSVKTKRPVKPPAEDFEHKIYCLW